MIEAFKKQIELNFPFLSGKKLLVACSGGVDSVVLTNLLHQLKYDISLAHCNFSLRSKESDEDEEFVINFAEKLSIPVHTETFDTEQYAKRNKLSIQMGARELRYVWFEEILDNFKLDFVLTAHHADDDIETFFINLSRGTGLKGLLGIPEENERVIRPLLPFGRDDIIDYAKSNNLFWREDSSNTKTDYLRNKLRLDVIPEFKEATQGLERNFQKTQSNLRASQNLVNDYMALIQSLVVTESENGIQIDIKKLMELPNTEALIYELLVPFGFTDIVAVTSLLTAQSGKWVVSNSHRLLKDRGQLILTELPVDYSGSCILISDSAKGISSPIKLKFELVEKLGVSEHNSVFIDNSKLNYPLMLRKWQDGDVFQPFGMKGKKKLSKFFKDEKLSLVAKEKIWVLCSDECIVWIVGMRLDDNFKVGSATREILKVTLIPQ